MANATNAAGGLGDPGPGHRRLWWLPLEDLATVLGAMAKVQTIGLLEVKAKTISRSLSPSWAADQGCEDQVHGGDLPICSVY